MADHPSIGIVRDALQSDDILSVATRGQLSDLLAEYDRLAAVIRWTHTTHCKGWPAEHHPERRHAPECLLYELEGE